MKEELKEAESEVLRKTEKLNNIINDVATKTRNDRLLIVFAIVRIKKNASLGLLIFIYGEIPNWSNIIFKIKKGANNKPDYTMSWRTKKIYPFRMDFMERSNKKYVFLNEKGNKVLVKRLVCHLQGIQV